MRSTNLNYFPSEFSSHRYILGFKIINCNELAVRKLFSHCSSVKYNDKFSKGWNISCKAHVLIYLSQRRRNRKWTSTSAEDIPVMRCKSIETDNHNQSCHSTGKKTGIWIFNLRNREKGNLPKKNTVLHGNLLPTQFKLLWLQFEVIKSNICPLQTVVDCRIHVIFMWQKQQEETTGKPQKILGIIPLSECGNLDNFVLISCRRLIYSLSTIVLKTLELMDILVQ